MESFGTIVGCRFAGARCVLVEDRGSTVLVRPTEEYTGKGVLCHLSPTRSILLPSVCWQPDKAIEIEVCDPVVD